MDTTNVPSFYPRKSKICPKIERNKKFICTNFKNLFFPLQAKIDDVWPKVEGI